MEFLEILDENGNPTGKFKLRDAIHRDGDWHPTVHIWIRTPDGRLLLQKRSLKTKINPSLWDITGGHVKKGMTSLQTVIDEAAEELGITLTKDDLEFLFRVKFPSVHENGKIKDNAFNDVYLVETEIDLAALHRQEAEVADLKLVSEAELTDILQTEDPRYVRRVEEYTKLLAYLKQHPLPLPA